MGNFIAGLLSGDLFFLLQEEVRNTVLLASSDTLDSLFNFVSESTGLESACADNVAVHAACVAVSDRAGVPLDAVLEAATQATSELSDTIAEELAAVERIETKAGC